MKRKPRILYCDDQERFLEDFIRRHDSDFEIDTTTDITNVFQLLKEKKTRPDLVVLDLYHPRDINAQSELAASANEKLQELSEKISEVKGFVDEAWSPDGIDILREIRERYPVHKVPVLIYTQRGLFLLEDSQLKAIEQLDCEWLLKDKARISAATEATRIRRYIRQS
ncbi:hypothetical protein ACFL4U_03410, partial [Candidatus Neomarinimicrobiota bacterium]